MLSVVDNDVHSTMQLNTS